MGSFCAIHKFKHLIKKPTCYKNPDNLLCIDFNFTNCPIHFQRSSIFKDWIIRFSKKNSSNDFEALVTIVNESLNKHALLKIKHLRKNHSEFTTKNLSKAIMCKSKLRKHFLKLRTPKSKMKHNKQRILCVKKLKRNITRV